MDISRDEAQESLMAIQQITAQTRHAVAYGGGPYYLIIWGIVWLFGYPSSQFIHTALAGWIWLGLDLAGVVASVVVGTRLAMRVRSPTLGPRIGLFWLALMGYSALWIWLAQPSSGNQMSLLIATMAMFDYIVMGLWLGWAVSWIGLTVTILALLGYYLLPAYFNLWMALLGGGTLIGSGLYILQRWR